jgi:iron complex outermembrane receptor protein
MKFVVLFFIALSIHQKNISAQNKQDSIYVLNEVSIKAYLNEQPLISLPASVSSISQIELSQKNTQSILPSLNAISGVKMEERSPGSYRLSIRGSLIRSAFGVRNLKIYYDDFPLSDAGGNTYLNLIDQHSIKNIEILKGPDGSLFGANSGGVVLINSLSNKKQAEAGLLGGSNALFSQHVNIQNISESHDYTINQAFQRGDGYRENSAMKRFFFQTQQKWRYNKNSNLKFSGFYADIDYQTPGGLTEEQMKVNPKLARANAISQQIGIRNQTLFGGLQHEHNLSPSFKHIISVSGIYTDFKNPFITNYEKRKEKSLALRSYVEWKNKMENMIRVNWNLGGEYQYTTTEIRNFGNVNGNPNGLQAADKINNHLSFLFNRLAFQIGEHFKSEVSASINFADYNFKSLDKTINSINGEKNFKNKVMPRFSASYLFNPQFSLRGIISKGYSLPTIAEVRASDAKINPNLEPEEGWNHEIGLRWKTPSNRLYLDIAAFYYKLDQAIVRRVNTEDEDFYVNAGGTNQKGIEFQSNVLFISSI